MILQPYAHGGCNRSSQRAMKCRIANSGRSVLQTEQNIPEHCNEGPETALQGTATITKPATSELSFARSRVACPCGRLALRAGAAILHFYLIICRSVSLFCGHPSAYLFAGYLFISRSVYLLMYHSSGAITLFETAINRM